MIANKALEITKQLLPPLVAYASTCNLDSKITLDKLSKIENTNENQLTENLKRGRYAACEPLKIPMKHSFPTGSYVSQSSLLDFVPLKKDRKQNPVKLGEHDIKSPGAFIIPFFRTEDGIKMIPGFNFKQQWKDSLGGAVEFDETVSDTIVRECKEEYFNLEIPGHGYISHDDINPNVFILRVRDDLEFDTFTSSVTINISNEELERFCNQLNQRAKPAQSALAGLLQSNQKEAAAAIKDDELMELIKNQKKGKEAVDDLILTAKGRGHKVSSKHREFKSDVAEAIKVYTEYSKFKVTSVESLVIQHLIDSKDVFHPGRKAFLNLSKEPRAENLMFQMQQHAYW